MPDSDPRAIEALKSLWHSILKRPIGIDDNFFDVGGTPLLAEQLFREIAKISGSTIPSVAIYDAPTIKNLAALITKPGLTYRCPALLLIKAGADPPPIFMAPGMGGDVTQFFQVARHIHLRHPLYGMQPRGLDGANEPLFDIVEMAQFYLREIQKMQPAGPYLLVGYSLGGLIMLEIARLLMDINKEVPLLVMVDTYPHMGRLAAGQQIRLLARLSRHRFSSMLRMKSSLRDNQSGCPNEYADRTLAVAASRVRVAQLNAWKKYRPRFYNGKITFIKADTVTYFPADPVAIWRRLVKDLEVKSVPGDHLGILLAHSQHLATALSCHLTDTLDRSELQGNI
jgi:thioesterase domain-containing protein